MNDLLPYFAVALSVAALILNALTFLRAGRWRDSEGAKALVERITGVERTADLHEQRIAQIEADVVGLPTKADFTRLEGEIKTTCAIADRTERAVLRLEDHILKADK